MDLNVRFPVVLVKPTPSANQHQQVIIAVSEVFRGRANATSDSGVLAAMDTEIRDTLFHKSLVKVLNHGDNIMAERQIS